jgi:ABC-type transport system involved in multi-copper enzyme maturation permease subunit
MERVLLIARNVFQGILSRRALYVWGAAVLLMILRSAPAFLVTDSRVAAFERADAVSGALDVWALLCIATAIFLGGAAVASDMTAKTIAAVLARPVRRSEYLVGKWIGISAFALVSMGIGVALDLAAAAYLGIAVDQGRLAIALAQTTAAILLYGGIAIALSAGGSAPVAVAFTVLMSFLPVLVNQLRNDPDPKWHVAWITLDYVVPPGYQSHYAGIAWADLAPPPNARRPMRLPRRPVIDYAASRSNLFTNIGYGMVYFLAGCVFFTRRDVRLGSA